MHYKLMLFAGQNIVEFSGANFSADAWVFTGPVPYVNYVDESVYFTDNAAFVHSFMTKFDDLWTNTTAYADYANVPQPLARHYPSYAKDPQLNFPPLESYANRSVEPLQPRDAEDRRDHVPHHRPPAHRRDHRGEGPRHSRPADQRPAAVPRRVAACGMSWNIDRLYMAGVQIKMRAHQGLNHQKLVLLYSQTMSIFGSSNWTSPSDNAQEEHNCFCTDANDVPVVHGHVRAEVEQHRGRHRERHFVPLPPDTPVTTPVGHRMRDRRRRSTSITLKWYGGPWAHKYDVYFGTDPTTPRSSPPISSWDRAKSVESDAVVHAACDADARNDVLLARRRQDDGQPVAERATSGASRPPAPPSRRLPAASDGPGDVVLYAAEAAVRDRNVDRSCTDASAAGRSPDGESER